MVEENLKKANARQAKYFNKNRTEKKYEIGDEVVRKNHVLSSAAKNFAAKLAPPFKGPCDVIERVSPVVYELRDKGKRKKVNVHVQDIKNFFPPLDGQKQPEEKDGRIRHAERSEEKPTAKRRGRPKGSKSKPINPNTHPPFTLNDPKKHPPDVPKQTQTGRRYG